MLLDCTEKGSAERTHENQPGNCISSLNQILSVFDGMQPRFSSACGVITGLGFRIYHCKKTLEPDLA